MEIQNWQNEVVLAQHEAQLCKSLPQGAVDVKACMDLRDGWTGSWKGKSIVAY